MANDNKNQYLLSSCHVLDAEISALRVRSWVLYLYCDWLAEATLKQKAKDEKRISKLYFPWVFDLGAAP